MSIEKSTNPVGTCIAYITSKTPLSAMISGKRSLLLLCVAEAKNYSPRTEAMWASRRIMLQVKPYSLSYHAQSFMKWPLRAKPA